MKRLFVCSFLTAALALSAAAADVTGRWSGSFTPESGQANTAYAVLKQAGTTVRGSAGPSEDQQWPDLKGTIKGNKVSVEVKSTSDGMVYKCDLVLDGDHLKGDISAAAGNGQTLKAKMDLTRVK